MRNNIPAAEFGKRDFRSEKKKRTVSLNYENTLRHEGETRFVVIGEITGEDNGGTRPR